MLTLDQCLGANRPLIFVVAESDLEVLKHINEKYRDRDLQVYSTTMANMMPLPRVLSSAFAAVAPRAMSTHEVFNGIVHQQFDKNNYRFFDYIFLDCQSYIHDQQHIRDIKDILSRYQLEDRYTISLVFISQTVDVPMELQRLAEVVFFDLPNDEALETLLHGGKNDEDKDKGLIKKLELGKKVDAGELEEIQNNIKGLTLYEVEQAFLQCYHIHKTVNIDFIRDFKKNSVAKTDLLSLLESKVTFDQIGGMDNLKSWIRKTYGGWTVEGQKYGLPPLKGLLLVGLPGAGKSLICKGIGNEWRLPAIQFDPSRIFSSRVGDSEANMRRVLNIVNGMAPCILFIDEIEKAFSGLGSSNFSDGGTTSRTIMQFLIWLNDNEKSVFTIATANSIEQLPPELIQRFSEVFFIGLPQKKEREDIFNIHLKKLRRNPANFDLKKLSEMSEDLSGREIEHALRESMYDAYFAKREMSTEIVCEVLSKKTNLITTMAEQLNYLINWVGYDEYRNDGIRARFASTPNKLDVDRVKNEIDNLLKEVEKKKPFED